MNKHLVFSVLAFMPLSLSFNSLSALLYCVYVFSC